MMDIDNIRPEEISAMEVYSNIAKDEMLTELKKMWPSGAYCGSNGAKGGAGNRQLGSPPLIKWAVIWTK